MKTNIIRYTYIKFLAWSLEITEALVKLASCIYLYFLLIRMEFGLIEQLMAWIGMQISSKTIGLTIISLLCFPTTFMLFRILPVLGFTNLECKNRLLKTLHQSTTHVKMVLTIVDCSLAVTMVFLVLSTFAYFGFADTNITNWCVLSILYDSHIIGESLGLDFGGSFLLFVYSGIAICLGSCLSIIIPVERLNRVKGRHISRSIIIFCLVLYVTGIVFLNFPYLYQNTGSDTPHRYFDFVLRVMHFEGYEGRSISCKFLHYYLLPTVSVISLNIVIWLNSSFTKERNHIFNRNDHSGIGEE